MSDQPAPDRPEAPAGPGRPVGPLGRTRRVHAWIPIPVLARLDERAEALGLSRSAALTAAAMAWAGDEVE